MTDQTIRLKHDRFGRAVASVWEDGYKIDEFYPERTTSEALAGALREYPDATYSHRYFSDAE